MNESKDDFYFNVLNNYDEYIKIADMCSNLSSIRINHLIRTFGGYNYENECYYNEFKNKEISYSIDILRQNRFYMLNNSFQQRN